MTKCFSCNRPLGATPARADTRDGQTVLVGRDCAAKITAAGAAGYQPPTGGPRLWPLPGEDLAAAKPIGVARTLLAACLELDVRTATVVDHSSGEWSVYYIDLPIGQRWEANGCTFIKAEWITGDATMKREAIADALEDVAHGAYDADADEIAEDQHNHGKD